VAGKKQVLVSPDVERRARLVALTVWDKGGMPARELVTYGARPEVVVEPIEVAVSQGWVRVQDDEVVPGAVNPRPATPVGDPESAAWGPVGDDGGLFRVFGW
jgi:hypothetical protein